jgi:hypothetical protein
MPCRNLDSTITCDFPALGAERNMPILLAFEEWARHWVQSGTTAGVFSVFFLLVAALGLGWGYWMLRRSRNAVDALIVEPDGGPAIPPPAIVHRSVPGNMHWLLFSLGAGALLISVMSGGCTALAARNYYDANANASWSAQIVERCLPIVENSEDSFFGPPPKLRGKLFVWDLAADEKTPSGHTERPSWVMLSFGAIPSSLRATRGDEKFTACFIVDADFVHAGDYQFPGRDETEPAYHADLKIVAVYWPSLEPAGCFTVRSEASDEVREHRETSGRFHFQVGRKILAAMGD